MTGTSAALVLLGLVALAALVGAIWRARYGRFRTAVPGTALRPADLGSRRRFDAEGTLVLFTSDSCANCPQARRLLKERVAVEPALALREVNLSDHLEVAREQRILQTPTVFLLDREGRLQGRFGGVPRPAELDQALHTLLGRSAAHAG